MSPSNPYVYGELPSRSSFRVLELLPCERSEGQHDIAYRLKFADWEDPPSYEAISYAWGDPNDVIPTICNDGILNITKSLHGALSRFRMKNQTRLLWADALWYAYQHAYKALNLY